ncbi:solute carrier family 13 member 4 isoform X2 [Protopterus annectens]|uniref:solute carrier family 13 member 4 isoform X2 n=1 Tax=Protopterus annectens TaxID=7888 RepID=UPI001CFAF53F|nr:solute carrier family 13 member 4 isoform X2 [Protopterus annectens]
MTGLTDNSSPKEDRLAMETACAYVLIVTAVYWVSEAVPLGAAALVPAFLYPLFGVLKSSEVASEYFKDTTLLFIGVICLATSIEKWNLHKRIALRMVMLAGAKPGMLVLGFMCCTAFLSMWLSNTSTTAMVMPIADAVLQQLINTNVDADNELEVITEADSTSFTDINDSVQQKEVDQQYEVKSTDLIFISENYMKDDVDSLAVAKNMNRLHLIVNHNGITKKPGGTELLPETKIVLPLSPLECKNKYNSRYKSERDHMICKCLSLSITYAATIGGITTFTGTATNLIFAEQFSNRYPRSQEINFGSWFIFSFPISFIMLVSTWFWLHWLFLGCNFRETFSLNKNQKNKREEISERKIQEEYKNLGPLSYPEMVTGIFFILMTLFWFSREPGFVPGWNSLFEKKGYRTDATVAVFLGFLLFLIPSKKPSLLCFDGHEERNPENKELDSLATMITWKDFQKLMPWEIIILVGGGYALAAGCKVSGLSVWIGRQLEPMSSLPPLVIILFACLLVSAVTEFASNPATITVFLPILSTLSETLQINPLYTLIPATICVAFGVMLPVGNPPNAIVFSYGHIQIKDMVKAGFGVNLIGIAAVMLATTTWGTHLFQLNTFPDWAIPQNLTHTLP